MGMPGRPKGSTTKPQFYTFVTDEERLKFVLWILKNYKKNPKLAAWMGDQLFGKAPQTLEGNSDAPIVVKVTVESAERYGVSPITENSSQ